MQGRKNYLYINTGTYASPTYVEVTRVRDVQHDDSRSEGDDSCRGFDMASVEVGQASYGCSFDAVYKRGDSALDAIQAAYRAGTPLGIMFLDGPRATAGSKGFRVDVKVTQFSRSEPLGDTTLVSIAMKGTTADGHELEAVTMS